MRTIRQSSSILVFWEDLVFLEAALLADDETKALASLITPVLDEFPATLKLDLDTRRALIQANARSFVADGGIDQVIRRLFSAVLARVEQNRKNTEFTTLFPTHIGEVVRHALGKQIEVAAGLVEKLALKIYSDDLRVPQTKALAAAIKRGKAVLAEVRKAELARVDGRLDLNAWKGEVNAARLTVYGQLLALSAKNGRGKAWAEGFFPRTSAGGPEEEETSDAAVARPHASETDAASEPEK